MLEEIKAIAGLKGVRRIAPRSIRHATATRRLRNGADIKSIPAFLGHSLLQTTTIYLHGSEHQVRKVIETVGLARDAEGALVPSLLLLPARVARARKRIVSFFGLPTSLPWELMMNGKAIEDQVRRAQVGDQRVFDELARRYHAAVLAVTFSRTGNRDEAEDLAQEVLLLAWERLPSLRDRAAFPSWLKAIAANVCRSWRRRSRPWPASLEDLSEAADLPASTTTDPVQCVLRREEERVWRRALHALPEANQIALLMHVWGGYSYEEIANFLGVPQTTVEGRIHRAKSKLRQLLGGRAANVIGERRRRWREQQ